MLEAAGPGVLADVANAEFVGSQWRVAGTLPLCALINQRSHERQENKTIAARHTYSGPRQLAGGGPPRGHKWLLCHHAAVHQCGCGEVWWGGGCVYQCSL